MEASEEKARLLSYYNAEFTRQFGGVVHPYTKKPIKSVQEYLDALESQETHRCIITKNTLTLDELQDIFAEKFKTYRKPKSGGNICGISDYLEAMEEQRQLGVIRQAQKRKDKLVEQAQNKKGAAELAKEAQKREEQKIAELKEQERQFLRKQRNEKIIATILAIVGIVVGALGWLFSAAAFGWCFRFLEQFPIISSILYFPSDIGMVTLTTVNTIPYLCGGMIAEKVGKQIARKIYAWILLALNVISIIMPLFIGQLGIKTLFIGVLGAGSCYLLTKDN